MSIKKEDDIDSGYGMTAISRSPDQISSPTKYLLSKNLIDLNLKILDYGCGRGQDAAILNFDKYDKYWFPELKSSKYDYIICNYVLNVRLKKHETTILDNLNSLLKKNGIAFIAVRRDIKLDGQTKKNTYQRNVNLDMETIFKSSSYEIYKMEKY